MWMQDPIEQRREREAIEKHKAEVAELASLID